MSMEHENYSKLEKANLERILHELTVIREEMVADTAQSAPRLDQVHANFRESARNLLHYLAFRRRDLRPLQLELGVLGLSSLGRAESHVLATVDAVLEILHRLAECPREAIEQESTPVNFRMGERLLAEHTETLFGPATPGRGVRIMVTCRAKPQTITPSFTTCYSGAWTVCESTALTTMPRRGRG